MNSNTKINSFIRFYVSTKTIKVLGNCIANAIMTNRGKHCIHRKGQTKMKQKNKLNMGSRSLHEELEMGKPGYGKLSRFQAQNAGARFKTPYTGPQNPFRIFNG